MAKPKLGSGARFRAVEKSIMKHSHGKVRDAGAIAAAVGRKKYGNKRFNQLAARGRRRHAKKR